jgi:hypothetical protein
MELYTIILFVLLLTAVADLHVGVANDAVNFLNSAVGSRAAPRRIILIVASSGVLAGTLFSGGMMEVARKGIFNPEHFVLHEVMLIFLAVMLTDVILLDVFNTFGLPTSVELLTGLADAFDRMLLWLKREDRKSLRQTVKMLKQGRHEGTAVLGQIYRSGRRIDAESEITGHASSLASLQDLMEDVESVRANLRSYLTTRNRIGSEEAIELGHQVRETAVQLRLLTRPAVRSEAGHDGASDSPTDSSRLTIPHLLRQHLFRMRRGEFPSRTGFLDLVEIVTHLENIRRNSRRLLLEVSSSRTKTPGRGPAVLVEGNSHDEPSAGTPGERPSPIHPVTSDREKRMHTPRRG